GEQPHLSDVLQEQLKGVGGHVRLEIECRLRLAPAALVGRALQVGSRDGRVELLDQLDLSALEEAVQLLDVRLVEIQLGDRAGGLGEGKDAELLAGGDEALDLFEFLQIRY